MAKNTTTRTITASYEVGSIRHDYSLVVGPSNIQHIRKAKGDNKATTICYLTPNEALTAF